MTRSREDKAAAQKEIENVLESIRKMVDGDLSKPSTSVEEKRPVKPVGIDFISSIGHKMSSREPSLTPPADDSSSPGEGDILDLTEMIVDGQIVSLRSMSDPNLVELGEVKGKEEEEDMGASKEDIGESAIPSAPSRSDPKIRISNYAESPGSASHDRAQRLEESLPDAVENRRAPTNFDRPSDDFSSLEESQRPGGLSSSDDLASSSSEVTGHGTGQNQAASDTASSGHDPMVNPSSVIRGLDDDQLHVAVDRAMIMDEVRALLRPSMEAWMDRHMPQICADVLREEADKMLQGPVSTHAIDQPSVKPVRKKGDNVQKFLMESAQKQTQSATEPADQSMDIKGH